MATKTERAFKAHIDFWDEEKKLKASERSVTFGNLLPGEEWEIKVWPYNGDGDSSKATITCETTSEHTPPIGQCPGGGTPQVYKFCQTCPAPNTDPTHTLEIPECSKEAARIKAQAQGTNCTISDGPCSD